MGARAPTKPTLRRSTFKCDVCGRCMGNARALLSHKQTIHSKSTKRKTKEGGKNVLLKRKVIEKPGKLTKVASKSPKVVLKVKSAVVKKTKSKASPKTVVENVVKPASTVVLPTEAQAKPEQGKIEFACPKCERTFNAYFSALKHIQKSHCVNSKDEKVSPHSPDLIMPIQINNCIVCNIITQPTEEHQCIGPNDDLYALHYVCAGCDEKFISWKQSDIHVSGIHCDGVESMFFPTKNEFINWKQTMEEQTQIKYLPRDKNSTKIVHRCTGIPIPKKLTDDTIVYCPSSIVVQEFSKGIQAHYYKTHYGHEFSPYSLTDRFKKYLITSLLEKAEGYTITDVKSDEYDLYLQFKTLMECVVLDAAKIDINGLKILIGKALDMSALLASFEEDEENDQQKLNDEQITKTLEGKKRFKRHDSFDSKKMKLDENSPKIVNSFSLGNNKIEDVLKELEIASRGEVLQNEVEIKMAPTFNDTYKDFVDKNFAAKEMVAPKRNVPKPNKNVKIKTKIGQFKPSPPKKVKSDDKLPDKTLVKVKSHKGLPIEKTVRPININASLKSKVDLEYEVKEQENDCNILILKI